MTTSRWQSSESPADVLRPGSRVAHERATSSSYCVGLNPMTHRDKSRPCECVATADATHEGADRWTNQPRNKRYASLLHEGGCRSSARAAHRSIN
jgi:hypothetical protein